MTRITTRLHITSFSTVKMKKNLIKKTKITLTYLIDTISQRETTLSIQLPVPFHVALHQLLNKFNSYKPKKKHNYFPVHQIISFPPKRNMLSTTVVSKCNINFRQHFKQLPYSLLFILYEITFAFEWSKRI